MNATPAPPPKHRFWHTLWQLFARLFIMLGLALLGWGLEDLPGFFASPVRAAYALMVAVQALIMVWLLNRLPLRDEEDVPREPEHWHYSLVELIYILAAFGDRRNILAWEENLPLRWLGVGIYLAGILLTIWFTRTWINHLRREGRRAVAEPVLLLEGPYRWIRYPNLLVLLLYGIGFSLAFRSWIGLAFVIPLAYIVIRRAQIWERMNAEHHKPIWSAHCSMNKKIIPFLY